MAVGRVPVTFEPAGITVWVEPGTTVLEASRVAGVVIPAPCGARGICGSCGVKVRSGHLAEPDTEERAGIARSGPGVRLACRARVQSPVTLRPVIAHPHPAMRMAEGTVIPLVAGVDLGTTTVAASLVDVLTGREVAKATVANRQQAFGADVLTRISAALDGNGPALRQAADLSVADALRAAAHAAGVSLSGVERVVIAGNTAMASLLLGRDVSPLASHPFRAPFSCAEELEAPSAISDLVATGTKIVVLAPVHSFVGGDALAGAYAHELLGKTRAVRLLVDVGTNAEVVLQTRKGVFVTSAAAGPSFEGAGVRCGGVAAPGAVERVDLESDCRPRFAVIGGGKPEYFVGSGLLSALALLRRESLLGADGALVEHAHGGITVRRGEDGIVSARFHPDGDRCLEISQQDVRSLQLAIGAVRTAVDLVLESAKIQPKAAEEILVAGAFGRAVHPDDLIELGMLPAEFENRVIAIGNSALDGAVMAALDPDVIMSLDDAARRVKHVDLASIRTFGAHLIEAMRLERR